ncbi:MAG: hypothetical protein E6K81_14245 [Candidatus Eisenbacteria bacterium]|uniref:Uncharacterized protein n=1 Tax=Eiseniibacteriota bacterium TaxID=2212470 RepID=A0A538U1Q9_UNCEI|nr:MAG: hypothetical protein E6K81_14245 [Candidatus Eisenbacteria bacterium]
MRVLIVALAVCLLAGCGAQQRSADTSTASAPPAASAPASPAGGAGTQAVAASAPKMIEALTNQKQVFECPKCGMDYDAAGTCSMDGAELVAMRVDYTCPMDHQPVAQAGHCPRCAMNARVEKTALAANATPGKP